MNTRKTSRLEYIINVIKKYVYVEIKFGTLRDGFRVFVYKINGPYKCFKGEDINEIMEDVLEWTTTQKTGN